MSDLVGNSEDRFSRDAAEFVSVAQQVGNSFSLLEMPEIIRFLHKFVDRINNSVPRVTVWQHKAPPSYMPNSYMRDRIEPRSEKTGLRGFRPGPTQTRLYNHTRWLEA